MSAEFEQKVVKELESINQILNKHEEKFVTIDKRLEAIDKKFVAIDKKFVAIDKKFVAMDKRFDDMDKRFDDMDKRFNDMDKRFNEKFEQIQHSLEVITQSVVLIENKISTEIPTLFDGYASNKELQELEHQSLTSLNLKVENHDIRISILEQNAI